MGLFLKQMKSLTWSEGTRGHLRSYSPVEINTNAVWSLIVNSVFSPHSASSPRISISVWVEEWLNQKFDIVLVAGKLTSGYFSDEPLAVCWWDPFTGVDAAIDRNDFGSASNFESNDWSTFTRFAEFFVDDVTENLVKECIFVPLHFLWYSYSQIFPISIYTSETQMTHKTNFILWRYILWQTYYS